MGTAGKVLGDRYLCIKPLPVNRLETQVKDPQVVLPHPYVHRPLKATAPSSGSVRHGYLGLPITTRPYGQRGGSRNSIQ